MTPPPAARWPATRRWSATAISAPTTSSSTAMRRSGSSTGTSAGSRVAAGRPGPWRVVLRRRCRGAVPVAEQARKVRRMGDAYGWAEVDLVVGEIGDRFCRAGDHHAQAGRTRGAAILDRRLRWLDQKAAALIGLSTPWGFLSALTGVAVAQRRLGPAPRPRPPQPSGRCHPRRSRPPLASIAHS